MLSEISTADYTAFNVLTNQILKWVQNNFLVISIESN